MTEGDPRVQSALILEHLRAGVAQLELLSLDVQDRVTLAGLVVRLSDVLKAPEEEA